MAKDRKIRYQQKLSHKEQYGGGTGYEREFLRNPERGPLTTNRLFGELDSLEYFVPSRLKYYRNRLQKAMMAYPQDLAKINTGLASYVNSAVYKTRELALLTQSILRAYDNCLLENYAHSPAEVQQAIPKDYFDNADWMDDFDFKENELISIAGILHYQ